MRYDIAIIGAGPAGISAAVTAKIRGKSIILLAKSVSPKIEKAELIRNYTGLPDITGSDLATAMQRHLDALGIKITQKSVGAVYSMGDYFALQTDDEITESRSVIIATGVTQSKTLEGEEKFLGRGVSYCATCDAFLCKDKDIAVIAYTGEALFEAKFLAENAKSVKYFAIYKNAPKEIDGLEVIDDIPVKIDGDKKAEKIICKNGEYQSQNTFIIRSSIAPDKLVPGLKTSGGHIAVNLQMETSIKGLFACGDIAGKPYQYIKSAGQGNTAALSAVAYLDKLA